MAVPEEAILKPKLPTLKNSDEWPAFILLKVNVTSQETGEQISLLSAHKDNPVRVTGRLRELEEDLHSLIRDPDYENKTIELKDVTTFAFAEYEDGTYGFWAAGQAGWFEIESTVASYSPIYKEMAVATSMLYMLADKSRKASKPKANLSPTRLVKDMSRVFRDYLAQGRDPTRFADPGDVQEGFHDHRDFLIASMFEGQEGIDWNDTPMLNYFQLKFPDDVSRIRSRVFQSIPKGEPKGRETRQQESVQEETPKKRKGRPRKDSKLLCPEIPVAKVNSDIASSGEEDYGNPNVLTRKRKSILQPRGSKYSKKAKKAKQVAIRHGRSPDLEEARLDDDDGGLNEDDENTPLETESPITTIQNGGHLDIITNPPTDRSSQTTPPPSFLPRKYLELKIVEYDLPTMEPQGPGDLWSCTFEGCYHRVHQALSTTGKAKVKDHFKVHQTQAQEKIDLVMDESRPYLPVDNLVRRLQAFAPPQGIDADLESAGRKFVAPVRRKY